MASLGVCAVVVRTAKISLYVLRLQRRARALEWCEQDVTTSPAPAANPVPTTTSITPTAIVAGTNSFILTVNGSQFIPGAVVQWNGSTRTTTVVSPTQVTAVIGILDVFAVGTATVTVFNPATGFNPSPDGGVSNGQTFTITAVPPAPPPVPGPTPTAAHGNVDDRRGKEWRQLTATRA